MLFVTNITWNSFSTQNSKAHALFRLCCLRYVLIYNQEVNFNFQITFLQLNVIKMFSKNWFSLTSGYLHRGPDNWNYFPFPLKVRVIGSRLYLFKTPIQSGDFWKRRFACIPVVKTIRSRCWIQSIPRTRLVNVHAPLTWWYRFLKPLSVTIAFSRGWGETVKNPATCGRGFSFENGEKKSPLSNQNE